MLRSVELRSVSSWVSGSDDVESTSLLLKNARASSESVVDSIFENMMTLETRGDIFVKWMSHVVSWYFYEEEALPLTSEIRALWETVKSVYGREVSRMQTKRALQMRGLEGDILLIEERIAVALFSLPVCLSASCSFILFAPSTLKWISSPGEGDEGEFTTDDDE